MLRVISSQSQVVSRVSGDTIWNAGDLTNKRFEVNSDLVCGVEPLETKMQELGGSDVESRERASNRSVP